MSIKYLFRFSKIKDNVKDLANFSLISVDSEVHINNEGLLV